MCCGSVRVIHQNESRHGRSENVSWCCHVLRRRIPSAEPSESTSCLLADLERSIDVDTPYGRSSSSGRRRRIAKACARNLHREKPRADSRRTRGWCLIGDGRTTSALTSCGSINAVIETLVARGGGGRDHLLLDEVIASVIVLNCLRGTNTWRRCCCGMSWSRNCASSMGELRSKVSPSPPHDAGNDSTEGRGGWPQGRVTTSASACAPRSRLGIAGGWCRTDRARRAGRR